MRKLFLTSILITASLNSARTLANGFSCQGTAGSVIFNDSLYGAGVATLLSGLYIWSKNDDKKFNQERAFTNGILTGASFGVGLGITEVVFRECGDTAQRKAESAPKTAQSWRLSFQPMADKDASSLIPAAEWSLKF